MTAPTPSQARVVRIAGANVMPARGRTLSLTWPPKHSLDSDWWWIDATGLGQDLDDTILQVGCAVVAGDGAMTVPATAVSTDALHAGFKLCQGTPGVTYIVRAHLTFTQGARWAQDVGVQVRALCPVPAPNPAYVTNNQDVILLGGIPFPSGASSS